jgi:hypothetical protein
MENTQLTIADLASMQALIEAACTRGAFRANEMRQVGELYDKLASFLSSLTPPESDPNQTAETPTPQGEANA